MADILAITDATFESDVLKSSKPFLLDFWAPWCGPCRAIAPILEEIAAEDDRFQIGKLNVDENPQTAMTFDVMSIPTMILFKDGKPAKVLVGSQPKKALLDSIASYL